MPRQENERNNRGGPGSNIRSSRSNLGRGKERRGLNEDSRYLERDMDFGRRGADYMDWNPREEVGSRLRGRADRIGSEFGRDRSYDRDQERYSGFGGRSSLTAGERGGLYGAPSRGGFFGKGPKGWRRSDERIREDVCEALYRARDVDASDIEVGVTQGTVRLSGTVDNRETKRAAEDWIENISGVVDVRNELRVKRESATDIGGTSLSQ